MPQVIVVEGGFGGVRAAERLGRPDVGGNVEVTLIDRTNHRAFAPLLYQVATAGPLLYGHTTTGDRVVAIAQDRTRTDVPLATHPDVPFHIWGYAWQDEPPPRSSHSAKATTP